MSTITLHFKRVLVAESQALADSHLRGWIPTTEGLAVCLRHGYAEYMEGLIAKFTAWCRPQSCEVAVVHVETEIPGLGFVSADPQRGVRAIDALGRGDYETVPTRLESTDELRSKIKIGMLGLPYNFAGAAESALTPPLAAMNHANGDAQSYDCSGVALQILSWAGGPTLVGQCPQLMYGFRGLWQ